MEEVCNRENLERAWKRVRRNKGSPGVDGMTIDDAKDYLREHWPSIRSQLLAGTYQPQPVKRVEIPKPDGGVRKLGVPCVVDRLIQQALLQVLQQRWDPTFSEHSYGFRPGRSSHQAVAQAQRYVAAGYSVVVEPRSRKISDRVNHDGLMARVAARLTDKRVLKLIRAFLKSGVMEDGLVSPVDEGPSSSAAMSTILRTLGNLRRIGLKVRPAPIGLPDPANHPIQDYGHQLHYIGDTKAGTLIGTDHLGNKFYEKPRGVYADKQALQPDLPPSCEDVSVAKQCIDPTVCKEPLTDSRLFDSLGEFQHARAVDKSFIINQKDEFLIDLS